MRKYIAVTIHPIKITRHDFDFGRGKRTPKTLLLIDERDALLREATRRFCIGMKDREAARYLRAALLRYQTGAWRRERVETTCPARHASKLTALLWMVLKVRDHVPSEMTIRRALAIRDPRDVFRFAI
jgi:hypothetical protein